MLSRVERTSAEWPSRSSFSTTTPIWGTRGFGTKQSLARFASGVRPRRGGDAADLTLVPSVDLRSTQQRAWKRMLVCLGGRQHVFALEATSRCSNHDHGPEKGAGRARSPIKLDGTDVRMTKHNVRTDSIQGHTGLIRPVRRASPYGAPGCPPAGPNRHAPLVGPWRKALWSSTATLERHESH